MRELDRDPPPTTPARPRCAVVGAGRVGSALAAALPSAGYEVIGPLRRGEPLAPGAADLVLLAVPDAEIAAAARRVPAGPLVGHLSGANHLEVLGAHEGFALHPLMTITGPGAAFAGAGAAVAGTTPRALDAARALAAALGMRATEIAAEHRAAYHAAASVASNFLITLEAAAERLAREAGAGRELLVPLVRATVENWAEHGEAALTGPIARGDAETVARQRAAVARSAPDLLPLWDALAEATRALAAPADAPEVVAC